MGSEPAGNWHPRAHKNKNREEHEKERGKAFGKRKKRAIVIYRDPRGERYGRRETGE